MGFLALSGALLGVLSHLIWFIHGSHLIMAPRYVVTATCGPALLTAGPMYYANFAALEAALTVAVVCSSWTLGLLSSMAVYRRFFHPLRAFPGPPQARWTQWWHVFQVINGVDNYRHLDRLHAQYGDYVRVGPNILSIADPDWVETIHNPHTKFSVSSTSHDLQSFRLRSSLEPDYS